MSCDDVLDPVSALGFCFRWTPSSSDCAAKVSSGSSCPKQLFDAPGDDRVGGIEIRGSAVNLATQRIASAESSSFRMIRRDELADRHLQTASTWTDRRREQRPQASGEVVLEMPGPLGRAPPRWPDRQPA
jgi:hypothetical protein